MLEDALSVGMESRRAEGLWVPGRDKFTSQEGNKTQARCIPSLKPGENNPVEREECSELFPQLGGMDDLSNTLPV